MKSIIFQKQMNNVLASKSKSVNKIKRAYALFVKMNELRVLEGLPYFTMPNLEKSFKAL